MPYSTATRTPEEIKRLRKEVCRRYAIKHRDKRAAYNKKYYEANPAKFRAWNSTPERREYMRKYRKQWKTAHPQYAIAWKFQNFFGITIEERDALLAQNNGLCQICSKNTATHIDHCHTTGKIRGALCHKCNVGIGMLGDDRKSILKAYEYFLWNED